MATTTPAVAVRKLEDIRILTVTPWSRDISGIAYKDRFVSAPICASARHAIEQMCSAATLERLRRFVNGDLGFCECRLWVLERAAKFEGLFWLTYWEGFRWQIQGVQRSWDNAVQNLINELTAGHLQSQRLCSQPSAVADLETRDETATDFCCATATHWCNTCKVYLCVNHSSPAPQPPCNRTEIEIAFFGRPVCLACGMQLYTLCLHDVRSVGKVLCYACPRTFIEVDSLDAHLESDAHGDNLAMGPPFYMSASHSRGFCAEPAESFN